MQICHKVSMIADKNNLDLVRGGKPQASKAVHHARTVAAKYPPYHGNVVVSILGSMIQHTGQGSGNVVVT